MIGGQISTRSRSNLNFLASSDFDLLIRRIPVETLQEHLTSDLGFIDELIDRLYKAGTPVQVQAEELIGLLQSTSPALDLTKLGP